MVLQFKLNGNNMNETTELNEKDKIENENFI